MSAEDLAPETRFLSREEACIAGVGNTAGSYTLTRDQAKTLADFQRDSRLAGKKLGYQHG